MNKSRSNSYSGLFVTQSPISNKGIKTTSKVLIEVVKIYVIAIKEMILIIIILIIIVIVLIIAAASI